MSLAGLRELMVISRASTLFYSGAAARSARGRARARGALRADRQHPPSAAARCGCRASSARPRPARRSGPSRSEVGTDELFEVQDRIVSKIVAGIAPNVRSAELQRAMRKRPESLHRLRLHAARARDASAASIGRPSRRRAVFLEQAMEEDPKFAMAVRLGGALAQHQCRAGLVAGLEGRRRTRPRGWRCAPSNSTRATRWRSRPTATCARSCSTNARARSSISIVRCRLSELFASLDFVQRHDELSRARQGGCRAGGARRASLAIRP